ncbi:MAG: hypothetical protein P4L81_03975 [Candidatus Pacebacteria bacterium]|nr:hypothetical protein [Candidatus Paceibacterota bacterium]
MPNDDLHSSPTNPAPSLATVSVRAGAYLAHDLAPAMSLVCTAREWEFLVRHYGSELLALCSTCNQPGIIPEVAY